MLGFDAIFVEHLLCKVIRWKNLLMTAGLLGVVDDILSRTLEEGYNWRTDAYPLPLHIDRRELYDMNI